MFQSKTYDWSHSSLVVGKLKSLDWEFWIRNWTRVIFRYSNIAGVKSLTPIQPTIRPWIKVKYQNIFECRYPVELFVEVWVRYIHTASNLKDLKKFETSKTAIRKWRKFNICFEILILRKNVIIWCVECF